MYSRRRSSRSSRLSLPRAPASTPTNTRSTPACQPGAISTRPSVMGVASTRDEDGDGFCEIHVNTMEGTWSLLRSWLRPHRGISQEKLPLYLGVFEFVHNARRRGKALLGALVAALVM